MNTDKEKMQRVSKQNPCPVCHKPDWCLVSPDQSAAICPRTPDGSLKEIPDSGYLHILRDDRRYKHRAGIYSRRIHLDDGEAKSEDFGQWANKYQQRLTAEDLSKLSASLGVSQQSLIRLQIGWDGQAYTFPMQDANDNIIGIRRRFPNGHKISAIGSKTGLFIPTDLVGEEPLVVCEGPTDTAAALDLGFDSIGRPNCNSKIEMTAKAARGRNEIVIIGDGDTVGRAGAEKLADALLLHYPCVKIIYPPDGIKDLRQWLQARLNAESLQQIIEETKPLEIRISFKD